MKTMKNVKEANEAAELELRVDGAMRTATDLLGRSAARALCRKLGDEAFAAIVETSNDGQIIRAAKGLGIDVSEAAETRDIVRRLEAIAESERKKAEAALRAAVRQAEEDERLYSPDRLTDAVRKHHGDERPKVPKEKQALRDLMQKDSPRVAASGKPDTARDYLEQHGYLRSAEADGSSGVDDALAGALSPEESTRRVRDRIKQRRDDTAAERTRSRGGA